VLHARFTPRPYSNCPVRRTEIAFFAFFFLTRAGKQCKALEKDTNSNCIGCSYGAPSAMVLLRGQWISAAMLLWYHTQYGGANRSSAQLFPDKVLTAMVCVCAGNTPIPVWSRIIRYPRQASNLRAQRQYGTSVEGREYLTRYSWSELSLLDLINRCS